MAAGDVREGNHADFPTLKDEEFTAPIEYGTFGKLRREFRSNSALKMLMSKLGLCAPEWDLR
jgi:hypothetical protein